MKKIGQRVVYILTNFLMQFRSFRFSFKQAVEEAQGFIYGSYNLADEAALAVSMLPVEGGVWLLMVVLIQGPGVVLY
jgi:hypothetical protein